MDDLTHNEREGYRSLSNDPNLPPELEEAVVASLRRQGAFAEARAPWWAWSSLRVPLFRFGMAAAVAVIAFLSGMFFQANRPAVDEGIARIEVPAPESLAQPAGFEPFMSREELVRLVIDGGADHYCEAHASAEAHYCTLSKMGEMGPTLASTPIDRP